MEDAIQTNDGGVILVDLKLQVSCKYRAVFDPFLFILVFREFS